MKGMDSDIEELLRVKKLEDDELTRLINAAIVRLRQQDYEIDRLTSKVAQLKGAIAALTQEDNIDENTTPQLLTESEGMPTASRLEVNRVFNEARSKFDTFFDPK